MVRAGVKSRAISMTRCDTWTSTEYKPCNSDVIADFCVNKCPHKETPCKGDCDEMKAFRKANRRANGGNRL